MATGITKREQHSEDSTTAFCAYNDILPLPERSVTASLAYPCKASPEDIIQDIPRQLIEVGKESHSSIDEIPENCFVLDDNYYALNDLVRTGKKATLFYLDPPYCTGMNFHSRQLEHAYNDDMGQAAYVEFMRRRLILIREVMSDDGSLYLHIGHQMLAHIKVILDEVFGSDNFRNLISRRKCSSKNFTKNQFANINDFILFYTKGRAYKWNRPGIDPGQDWIEKEYPKVDSIGRRFKLVPVHAPGTRKGETGQPWRGMLPPPGKHWQYTPAKLEELDRNGDIHWSRNGNPRRKVYWSSAKKMSLADYWDIYRDAHHQSIKITGYPTEKNLEMIKMIVGASSEEGDLVVDPFCGSGTTLQAARELGRNYIGVDSSFLAAKATLRRMRHGLDRMGDYVNGNRKTLKLPLPFPRQVQPCTFVTDGRLLAEFEKELRTIGSI